MKKLEIRKLVLGALMAALVVILQYMGSFVRFGPFSIFLVLIPIVIGAITCGKEIFDFPRLQKMTAKRLQKLLRIPRN